MDQRYRRQTDGYMLKARYRDTTQLDRSCTTRHYTRHLIPEVGKKVIFPVDRDVGISYVAEQYDVERRC